MYVKAKHSSSRFGVKFKVGRIDKKQILVSGPGPSTQSRKIFPAAKHFAASTGRGYGTRRPGYGCD